MTTSEKMTLDAVFYFGLFLLTADAATKNSLTK